MPKFVIYITAGFLFAAILPLPYGYYTILRIVVCGAFAWAALIAFDRNVNILPWAFIVLAIIFNPVIKIHFSKEMWAIIDFASGVVLLLSRKRISERE